MKLFIESWSRHSDRYFDSRDFKKDLAGKTARGGVVMLASQGVRFGLQLGSTMALARLLTPQDFGLVGMVTVLMNLIVFFRDFGLTQATVQRPEVTQQQISNLFWVNIFISLLIAVIFAGMSPLIALFYGRSELVTIAMVLSVGVLLEGVGLQHRALMFRVMDFKRLAFADVGAQFLAVGISVYIALSGHGYWALVGLTVSGACFRGAFFVILTRWIPSLPRRRDGTKPFIAYGMNLFGFNLVKYFARNADNLLIGRFIGAEALGFYANAYRFMLLPIQHINGPLNKVLISSLSRLQGDPRQYRNYYRKSLAVISYCVISILGLMALCASEIVLLALGDQWTSIIPIFWALIPLGYISATNFADGAVYASLGHTRRQFRWYLFVSPMTVALMLVGLPWGTVGVAWGASAGWFIFRPISIFVCFHGTFLKCSDFLNPILRPTSLSFITTFTVWAIFSMAKFDVLELATFLSLLAKTLVFCVAWLIFDIILPGDEKAYRSFYRFYELLYLKKNEQ